MDEQTITDAFRKLYKTRQDLAQASEKTRMRRSELEQERAARMMSGEIVGKNEAERNARAQELLMHYFLAVDAADLEERQVRLAHDLARIEVERIDFLLRLMAVKASDANTAPKSASVTGRLAS